MDEKKEIPLDNGNDDVSRTPLSRFIVSSHDTRTIAAPVHEPGSVIANRYRVEETIGAGGMGTVYKVTDSADENKILALKLVAGESNPVRLETFRNEFRILTRLNHENLVRVFDFGVLPAGDGFFYTAEYIDGKNLREACDGADEEVITDYIVQTCRGLEYVHTRGYVHYDIKPKNILVDGSGVVKIMDFGLSALAGRGLGKTIRGTPAYTAPEVISRANVDGRADLYSLGMSIYEIIAGGRPFSKLNLHELMQAHVLRTPEPILSVRADAPPHLARIAQRLLAKNPGDRFESANAVIQSIAKARGIDIDLQPQTSVEGYLLTPPMKSRDEELELVRGYLDRLPEGGGHIIFEGPPGIGRTRLLREVHFEAQLRGYATASCPAREDDVFDKLAGEISLTPGVEAPAAPDDDVTENDKKHAANALPDSAARILAVAEQKPVVLCIDDAHAASVSNRKTIELLTRVLSTRDRPSLLLVTTRRDTDSEEDSRASGLVRRHLRPLSRDEVGEVVTEMFSRIPAPDTFVTRLSEATGGIPHAVVEVIRMLVASGDIKVIEGKWLFRGGDKPFDIPKSLDKFYDEQVASLIGLARGVALSLSIIDREVTMTELTSVHNAPPEDIAGVLTDLDRYGIIRRTAGRTIIANPGIRDAVVSSVEEKAIRKKHLEIAENFEHILEYGPTNLELSHHFLAGGMRRKALKYGLSGIEEDEHNKNRARAIPILKRLVDSLPERSRGPRAKILYALAAARGNTSDPSETLEIVYEYRRSAPKSETRKRRGAMERIAAFCHNILNQHEEAGKAWTHAIELARPGSEQYLRAISAYENMLEYRGRFDEADKLLSDAVTRFGDKKNIGMVAIMTAFSRICYRLGRMKDAVNYLERALSLGREIGEDETPEQAILSGMRYHLVNDFEKAVKEFKRARQLAIDGSRMYLIAMANNNIAASLFETGGTRESLQYATEAETIWLRYGDFRSLTHFSILLGRQAWHSSGCARALKHFMKGLEYARLSGAVLMECFLLNRIAEMWYFSGDFRQGIERAEEGIRLRDSSDIPLTGEMEMVCASCHAFLGNTNTARDYVDKAMKKNVEPHQAMSHIPVWSIGARLMYGDIKPAYEQIRVIEALVDKTSGRELFNILITFCEFWVSLGQFERVAEILEQISKIPEVGKVDLLRAESAVVIARVSISRKRFDDAETALRRARHILSPDQHYPSHMQCMAVRVELELGRENTGAARERLAEFEESASLMPEEALYYTLMSGWLRARVELLAGKREEAQRISSTGLEKAKEAGYRNYQLYFAKLAAHSTGDESEAARLRGEVETIADEFAGPLEEPTRGAVRKYLLEAPPETLID